MTVHLGHYNASSSRTHVRFQFTTNDGSGGAVAPSSAFEAADLRIYRAAGNTGFSATQRSSSAGITMTSPFDSVTGLHDVDIDLTDNSDSGFYAAGFLYSVVLVPDETVDSQTVVSVLACFEIGPPQVNVTQFGGTAQSGGDLVSLLTTLTNYVDTEIAAILAAVDTEVGAIKAKTDGLPSDPADASDIAALFAAIPAAVNAEVLDVLNVDNFSEPASVPASNAPLAQKIGWLFTMSRNKRLTTSTTDKVRNDADSADIATTSLSDNGTTFTRGEYA